MRHGWHAAVHCSRTHATACAVHIRTPGTPNRLALCLGSAGSAACSPAPPGAHLGCRALERAKGAHHRLRHTLCGAADFEVLDGSLGLGTPQPAKGQGGGVGEVVRSPRGCYRNVGWGSDGVASTPPRQASCCHKPQVTALLHFAVPWPRPREGRAVLGSTSAGQSVGCPAGDGQGLPPVPNHRDWSPNSLVLRHLQRSKGVIFRAGPHGSDQRCRKGKGAVTQSPQGGCAWPLDTRNARVTA